MLTDATVPGNKFTFPAIILKITITFYFLFEILRLIAKKIYKREALGKGDSKLVSMMAIWLGPLGISLGIAISYVIAAALGAAILRPELVKVSSVALSNLFLGLSL